MAYRVTASRVPSSERPALASFAPLFDGHPRVITQQDLADYVAQEFGDELEVRHGHLRGSPLHWYERCVVDPLRAEGLVSVSVEQEWLGSVQFTHEFLEPTADGERVAAWYGDVLTRNKHRRDWRRAWRAPQPVLPGPHEIAVTTLQFSKGTKSWRRLFVDDEVPGGGFADSGM